MSPAESSGASPDREAVAAVLAQCDADFARDLGAAPAELVGFAGKVVKAVHLRMADAVLSLLGATPREDARANEARALLMLAYDAIDPMSETIRKRIADFIAPLACITADDLKWAERTLGATEPAKEPDVRMMPAGYTTTRDDLRGWHLYCPPHGAYVCTTWDPLRRAEEHARYVAIIAPPVMAEAAREAPELPPGAYSVDERDDDDADATLLADLREALAALHYDGGKIVGWMPSARMRAQLVARIDARLGERP